MTNGTGPELVVDLRGRDMATLGAFWDAVMEPCGLPTWFGRNADAWADTIQVRGISEVIDGYDFLVVHVDRQGIFASRSREAGGLRRAFAGRHARLVVQGRDGDPATGDEAP